MPTVMKTYKYPLYNSKKNKYLDQSIDLAAEIWNHCIMLHKRYYKLYGKHLSANRLKVHIAKLKKLPKYAHWNQLGSQAIQDIVERIERSYKAFFNHVKQKRHGKKSPPKFKKRENYSSFTLKQAGYHFHDGNHITIMGRDYKYVAHRPMVGEVKTVTVKRTKSGKYYIVVVCKQEFPDMQPRVGKAIGLDFGLKNFLTTSEGTVIESPAWFQSNIKRLRQCSQKVSRCQKGSNNRKRAIRELEHTHERICNQRRDWFFKLANQLTTEYTVICIEDLNIKAMQKLWGRKISDYAFSEFVSILEWCAFKNGAQVVKIDRWAPSSKACNQCGVLKEDLTLDVREWDCPACGAHHDRDINAAINIRNLGVAMLEVQAA